MDDGAVLEAMHRETARRVARQDGLRARIRAAMPLFGDDEQPRVRLPDRGVWSEDWEYWDRSRRRYSYRLPVQDLVTKADYELLAEYGTLEQLELAWAAIYAHLPKSDELSAPTLASAPVKPSRNVERYIARVKRAMVQVLVANPNADLISPGACALVANKAGVGAKTMTNWFAGSGITLTNVLSDLLPEASAEATQERAAGTGP
jgi:hypothetical protein